MMSATSCALFRYVEDLVTDLRSTVQNVDVEVLHRIVAVLRNTMGHIYVTGIGKSSIAAHKCAASLASIGVAAHYLHATEALHGGCGSIGSNDVLICLSDSGETIEVITLIKILRQQERCSNVIAIVGNEQSSVAKMADYVLTTQILHDDTIFTYIPTSSVLVSLMLCDVLLLALTMEEELTIEAFKQNHPGGTLGKITLTAGDIMQPQSEVPSVRGMTGWFEIVDTISKGKIGCVLVLDTNEELLGIITDGDIRRAVTKRLDVGTLCAYEVMTQHPQICATDTRIDQILCIMETHAITVLPVMNQQSTVGIVHIHHVLQHYRDLGDVVSPDR